MFAEGAGLSDGTARCDTRDIVVSGGLTVGTAVGGGVACATTSVKIAGIACLSTTGFCWVSSMMIAIGCYIHEKMTGSEQDIEEISSETAPLLSQDTPVSENNLDAKPSVAATLAAGYTMPQPILSPYPALEGSNELKSLIN